MQAYTYPKSLLTSNGANIRMSEVPPPCHNIQHHSFDQLLAASLLFSCIPFIQHGEIIKPKEEEE
jgi:hypothetical protein